METKTENTGNNRRRRTTALVIFSVVALIGLVSAFFYTGYRATHITTDDAFIEGRVHTIASKVEGTVRAVHVRDNQAVKKGDLLVELDAADFDVRMQEAAAALNAERSRLAEIRTNISVSQRQLAEMEARVEAARANLDLQNANLRQAAADLRRAENLLKKEAISRERYEKIHTGHDVAGAQVRAAREQVKQAEAGLESQRAVIRQIETALKSQAAVAEAREATLRKAELVRGYTKITAPADGIVTRKSVEAGNQIRDGQPLMAVVAPDDLWVTANYKETQLAGVRPGQRVRIRIDTYPDTVFWGRVESIMAGTGAVFSLFPPENATGNYVKVVQRIPVRIALDPRPDAPEVLRVGMSVVPTILVNEK